MSITYKDLLPDDISIQDFKSHKEWNIHHTDLTTLGFKYGIFKKHSGYGAYYSASQFFGDDEGGASIQSSTGSTSTGPLYDRLAYSSLLQTFYRTGSISQSFVDGVSEHTSQNAHEYNRLRDTNGFYNPDAAFDSGSIWQLPTNIIGEGIKPGSLVVSHSGGAGISFQDDGNGNVINAAGAHKGNIFYRSGIVVCTSFISDILYGDFEYQPGGGVGGGTRNIYFKSTLSMTEHEYYCTIQDGEYNQSVNPTILSGSNNGVAAGAEGTGSYILRSIATSSAFTPYITTVGLYNDSGDLCATGKLARPLKNSNDYDISIVVRFDA